MTALEILELRDELLTFAHTVTDLKEKLIIVQMDDILIKHYEEEKLNREIAQAEYQNESVIDWADRCKTLLGMP